MREERRVGMICVIERQIMLLNVPDHLFYVFIYLTGTLHNKYVAQTRDSKKEINYSRKSFESILRFIAIHAFSKVFYKSVKHNNTDQANV